MWMAGSMGMMPSIASAIGASVKMQVPSASDARPFCLTAFLAFAFFLAFALVASWLKKMFVVYK